MPAFMPHRPLSPSRGSTLVILTLIAGAAASASQAQTANWANPNGGSASLAANWSPAAVPGAAHSLVFNIASALATMPVTFPAAVAASAAMTFRQESYTLTMSSPHTTGGLTIGDLAGDNAALVVATGGLTATGPTTIGDASGSTGSLSVNDDDASFIFNAPGQFFNLGLSGAGTLLVTGGGLVDITGFFRAATFGTSTATITVSGQLNAPPFSRSRLLVADNIASIGSGGDAALNVTNSALAQFSGAVAIAATAGGSGTATVQGASGILDATVDVGGNLQIGMNTGPGGAGTGTMNVGADGLLDVAGTIIVGGDAQGGTGTLHLGGGVINTTSLAVGAGSTLDLDSGDFNILGGTLTNAGAGSHFSIGGAGDPIVTLRNAAQGTLSVITGGRVLTVGGGTASADLADFNVRAGADLLCSGAGSVLLGELSNDDGGMIISDPGSTFAMSPGHFLIVGQSGNGRFEAELGAVATLGKIEVALNAGSTGAVLLESPGTIANTNAIFVGGSITTAGGDADFIVNAQAICNVTSTATDAVKVWPAGLLDLSNGATLNANKAVRIAGGRLDLDDGGVLNAPQLMLEPGSILEVNGEIPQDPCTANAETTLSGTATISLFGDLTIGDAASAAGFSAVANSTMNLRGNSLTILDSNGSGVGTINLTSAAADPSATLTAAQQLAQQSGASLTGHGLVDAPFIMQFANNSIVADGAGIDFVELLTNNAGGAISGTIIEFLTGGGYTGQGTIAARVNAHAKSTITATGNLTMGTANPAGFAIAGVLKCGGHLVTLIDSNGVTLGSKTEFINTVLTQSISLGVPPGSDFQGMGTVDTGLLSLNGDIKPGDTDAGGPETDTITCTGDIQIGAQMNYLCHIGPPGLGEELPVSDRIQTTGAGDLVQINGGTLNVQLLPFYSPQSSDKFDVVKGFAGVSGFFDTHILPPGARVSYLPNAVRVHFCYPDCDGDAALTIDDFICFQTEFALGLPEADCDGDTFLSIDDFICFQTSFAVGC